MNLDDRLTIDTPEGVSIDLTLAGLASRFGAAVLDILIQGILLLAVVLALALAGSNLDADLGVFVMGIGTLVIAVVVIGYYVLFEALNGGRTPGKAAFGIRVTTVDGTALTLGAVTLRTLMRLVDFLPAAYAVGAIAIVSTSRNQRLGDMVAGTVVIRDRAPVRIHDIPDAGGQLQGWDVSAVTDGQLALARRFLARRADLAPDARARLSADLATRLRSAVSGGERLDDEEFLAQLVIEKQARR